MLDFGVLTLMPEKDLPPIAKRLRALRDARGLTQQELAFQSGLSISIVAQLEQGGKLDPRVSTLTALAKALGVGIQDLTEDKGKSTGEGRLPAKGRKRRRPPE